MTYAVKNIYIYIYIYIHTGLYIYGRVGQDDERGEITNSTYFNMYTKTELCDTPSDMLSNPSAWTKRCFELIRILILF